MPSPSSVLWSSIGKKILTGLTGAVLFLFIVVHLLGNLTLLTGHGEVFNAYSHFLISLGKILIVIELILLAAFLLHILTTASIALRKRKARPVSYYKVESAGKPSRKSFGSSTMIYSGLVVLVFTVLHLKTFKFGPGIAEGYVAQIKGESVRDLYRLVIEVFSNKWYVLWYVVAMIPLGLHLSHGFWSAFQSLGVNHPRYTPALYALGYGLAVVIAVGYLLIPIWIYFTGV